MKKGFKKTNNPQPARRRRSDELSRSEVAANEKARTQFRRNRTLTGSGSATVSSSNELNAEFRSPRAHVHHLATLRRRIIVYLVVVALIGFGLYIFASQLVANVTVTDTSRSLPVAFQQKYEKEIIKYYGEHPTERLYFALHADSLVDYMQTAYPEISTIVLQPTGNFGEAQAEVTLRKPIARWSINGKNEFVDEQGIVFDYNAYKQPAIQIVDATGASPISGGIVTSHRFLAFVGRVVGAMKQEGYTVTRATIPTGTTRQLSIKVRKVHYSFKLTVDRSAGEQVEDISRIVSYLKKHHKNPDYVDVRVEGRAFYR